MPILEARNVCKDYRAGARDAVHALRDVSVHIARGSFTVLTGPSGSGKTTLLALLGVLDRPSRGQVLFEGRDLSGCSDVERTRIRRRLGFVFQQFALLPNLPVWENITYPLVPRGVGQPQRLKTARRLLESFGMGDKLHMRPRELSGGEQQRVAFARALAGEPEAILADEPTSNLDAAAGEVLASCLRQFHHQGKTVIACSHDPIVIALATDRIRLEGGRLQLEGG